MVGNENKDVVLINDVNTRALIDSGSSISTITEEFLDKLDPKPDIYPLDDFHLDIQTAGGHSLPYKGYVRVDVKAPFIDDDFLRVPMLVVPLTDYNSIVPVIIGTNVIRRFKAVSSENNNTTLPDGWRIAFNAICDTHVGVVKSTNRVVLQPMECKTVVGFTRKVRTIETALTEQAENCTGSRLNVCPRVVGLNKPGTTARVPVKVFNISAKVVTIPAKSTICELNEIKVLRSVDLSEKSDQNSKVNVQHQAAQIHEPELPVNLDLSDSCLSEEQKAKAKTFLSKWHNVFSRGPLDLGHTQTVKHEIHLNDEKPFKEPYRHIPPSLIQEVREHLKEMMQMGAIRESSSSFSSNVVLVRKKDGSIRFCIDYRKLNQHTIKDAHAIPRIDDTLHLLAGAKYFSTLDLKAGYWQVELREEDKAKTAFQVGPLGFYEANRMPFGLCNAPATFQRLMERCMGELNLRDCLIYLDDIIVFSSTFEEHVERLSAVFQRLEEHNLKLKPSKCELFRSRVLYLGHIVSCEGIQTDPSKIDCLKNWPIPECIKDVRKFLGFTGYYRRFVKGYGSIAKPLTDLLIGHPTNKQKSRRRKQQDKRVPFKWGVDQQNSFDALITHLTNPPVLAFADYTQPFILHTDASSSGLGAVLYQMQDGTKRVIAYASRSLRQGEKNYPAHKLEFLSLKWAVVEKFHDYLYGSKFEAITDNNPLTYIFTTAKLDATGQRWVAALSTYNFSIKYRKGSSNADADGLSRMNQNKQEKVIFPEVLRAISQSVTVSVEQCPFIECLALTDVVSDRSEVVPEQLLDTHALSTKDWRKAQRDDPTLKCIIDQLESGSRVSVPQTQTNPTIDSRYFKDWERLYLSQGVLYRKATFNEQEFQQLVIPLGLRDVVFGALHDDLGHQGRDRTTSLIKQRFFWPGMDSYIRERVRHCERCIKRKTPQNASAELVSIVSSAPLEIICLDYLSLERSKGGFENILVVTDHFSRYAQAFPTKNQTARTTARVLFDNFIVHYGFPARIHSDQGQNFESNLIKELCSIAGTEKSRTTPYHAMGNGQCERFNQTLLKMLGTLEDYQKSDWKAHVAPLVHAYNATFHDSTGYSPYFLMFGRHPRLAVDAFLGLSPDTLSAPNQTEYVRKLKERLHFAYKKAQEAAKRSASQHKRYYDLKVRNSGILHPGDPVLVRNVGLRGKHKIADRWENQPYVVVEQPHADIPVYVVKRENSKSKKTRTLHRNLLLPFSYLPCDRQARNQVISNNKSSQNADTLVSSSHGHDKQHPKQSDDNIPSNTGRYIIPMKRKPGQPGLKPRTHSPSDDSEERRPVRVRRKPAWMNSDDWVVSQHTFNVQPHQVVYI